MCLDTHALHFWLSNDRRLPATTRRLLDGGHVYISSATLWEMAQLVQEEKIRLDIDVQRFLQQLAGWEALTVVDITPSITVRASRFGPLFPRDPMDRLIASTALELSIPLVTSDERITRSGVVPVVWD
jgi:PIN domain nuclease of toxin-antitoxin system